MSRTNVQIQRLKMAENRFMAGIAMILSIILQSYNHFYSIFERNLMLCSVSKFNYYFGETMHFIKDLNLL